MFARRFSCSGPLIVYRAWRTSNGTEQDTAARNEEILTVDFYRWHYAKPQVLPLANPSPPREDICHAHYSLPVTPRRKLHPVRRRAGTERAHDRRDALGRRTGLAAIAKGRGWSSRRANLFRLP